MKYWFLLLLSAMLNIPPWSIAEDKPGKSKEVEADIPECPRHDGKASPCVALYQARCSQAELQVKIQAATVELDRQNNTRGESLRASNIVGDKVQQEYLARYRESYYTYHLRIAQLKEAIAQVDLATAWTRQGREELCPKF